jgi:hypothetical protein
MPFDPDLARRRLAEQAGANTAGTSTVAPAQAQEAIRQEKQTGIPASAGMYAPQSSRMALSPRDTTISQTNPAIRQWAQDPAHAAATADDYPSLAEIADHLNPIKNYINPLKATWENLKKGTAENYRAATDPNRKRSPMELIPGFSPMDRLIGGAIAAPVQAAWQATLGGLLNVGFVQPGAEAYAHLPSDKGYAAMRAEGEKIFETSLLGLGGGRVLGEAAAGAKMAGAGAKAAPPPKPYTPSGHGVDEHGFVTDPAGNPVAFNSPQEAARWAVAARKSGLSVSEVDRHPVTGTVSLKAAPVKPEFTEPPPPGVEPTADVAYAKHAQENEDWLKTLEAQVAETPSLKATPELTERFVEQVAPEKTISIDSQHLWLDAEVDTLTDLGLSLKEVENAYNRGVPITMPLSKYLSLAQGKPWAEALRTVTALDDGISTTEAKELGKQHPVLELNTGQDLDKVFLQGGKAQEDVSAFVQATEQAMEGFPSIDDMLTYAKQFDTWSSEDLAELKPVDQDVIAAWKKVQAHAGGVGENNPSSEPQVDEDTLAAMADQGLSQGDYFSQTGKEFPEPEDLDTSDFTDDEHAQWNKAKAAVKAVAPRVLKERFLDKLFKDQKAAGMTLPQYTAYSTRVGKAFDQLVQKLWKQTHEKVRKQYTKEWKSVYDNIFPEVMNEYMARPVVMAEHALRFSKTVEDELLKDNKLLTNGKPTVFYHGSSHSSTIGTPDNPWRPTDREVISFTYNVKFADDWMDGPNFNPYHSPYYDYNQDKAMTLYVVNIKAKNPADFRNPEHVRMASEWYADRDARHWDTLSDSEKRYALLDQGLKDEINAGTRQAYLLSKAKQYVHNLKEGSWSMWERPDMWDALGFDAAHMVEYSGASHLNICVANGNQIYFRYRQAVEQAGYKIATSAKKLYPAHMWDSLPNSMFSASEGRSVDEVAAELGFSSGEDMLQQLVEFEAERGDVPFRKHLKQSMEAEARRRTVEQIGDVLSPDRIMEDARALFTAPEIESVMSADLQQLAKLVGRKLEKGDVETLAREQFGQLKTGAALKIKDFERAVKKWGDASELAMAKGKPDYLAAFEAKNKQLINFVQLQEVHKLLKEFDKFKANVSRWATHKALPNMAQEYLDRIHQVLMFHTIPVRRDPEELLRGLNGKDLGTWVQEKQDDGEDIFATVLPPQRPEELSVDDYRLLNDMLTSFATNARKAKEVLIEGKTMSLDAAVEEAIASSGGIPNKPLNKDVGDWMPPLGKAARSGSRFDAAHRILESLFDYLDGGPRGIHNRVLQDGATDAANTVDRLQHEIYSPILDEFEKLPKELRNTYRNKLATEIFLDPRDNLPLTIRRGDLLSVLLNMGTKSNKVKLVEGYQTSEEAVLDLLNQHMTAEEVEFVQFIWDKLTKDLFPLADANARKLRGYGLSAQRSVPLEVAGVELSGGYYPLMYDAKFNTHPIGPEHDPERPTIKPFKALGTPTGFEKERTGYVGPILLSVDRVLKDHLRDVFVRIAYGEYVNSARHFIMEPRVRALWINKLGPEFYNLLMPWLQFQVFDVGMPVKDTAVIQGIMRKLRQNMTLTTMGWSASVGIKQTLGLVPAVSELGLARTLDGVKSFYFAAMTGKANEMIYDKSEEMRYRHWNLEQNVRDTHADIHVLDVTANDMQRFYKKWGDMTMAYINAMDKWTVTGAVWVAGYKKARFELHMNEGDAIRFADKIVRKTQGTGRPKDLPAVQRPNNEFQRILTFAYTWPGRYYNLLAEAGREFKQGEFKTGANKAFWLLLALPVIQAWADGDIPDEQQRKHPMAVLAWYLRKAIATSVGSAVYFRDIANIVDRKLAGKYAGDPRTPFSAAVDAANQVAFKKHNKAWVRAWANLLGMAGLLPGAGQIGKTAQFAYDVSRGKQKPKNPGDWLEGLRDGKMVK